MGRADKLRKSIKKRPTPVVQPTTKKVEECCSYCGREGHSIIGCPLQQYGAMLSTGILGC
jgi:hypothetical protein